MPVHMLPYLGDGAGFFRALRGRMTDAVWLDSAGGAAGGRWDVMAAQPTLRIRSRGGETETVDTAGRRQRHGGDPLEVLREALGPPRAPEPGVPFCGGAIGYFGYDLGRRLEGLIGHGEQAGPLPELVLGLYDWAVVSDHRRRESCLAGPGATGALARALRRLAAAPPAGPVPFSFRSPVQVDPDRPAYLAAFRRVMRYIRDGDCYQVNLARRFRARYEGDPFEAYRRLRRASPAPFGAYLGFPEAEILSISPERFLRLREGLVETRPIKGTRPRGPDPESDAAAARALARSAKDRAENLMIVDLLRNDLGKTCATGTVAVPELFRVESYATVHHLVSTVTGRLPPDRHATDLLRGCLPGGSITGAPKRRAMEVIDELEPGPRGVYCGAIGYLGRDGAMDTSIAIRTAVAADGWLEYRAGGGIVADSRARSEFRETGTKAAAFLQTVEESGREPAAGGE